MDAAFWDNRYAGEGFVFGKEPNTFLAVQAGLIEAGPVLCLSEGEGRNAVFLASRGLSVTAVDQSAIALEKARQLAQVRGVKIETVLADLSEFDLGLETWGAIVSIWAHFPSRLRSTVHARCVQALKPGGILLLEAYTPAQLRHGTGGPRDADALMTLASLRNDFAGFEFIVGHEIEREIHEGSGHEGTSAVVQVAARKPSRLG